MKRLSPLLAAAFLAFLPSAFAQPASPIDGNWSGRSDGGSCNAPLDYAISIDSGIVDGTAFDTTAAEVGELLLRDLNVEWADPRLVCHVHFARLRVRGRDHAELGGGHGDGRDAKKAAAVTPDFFGHW